MQDIRFCKRIVGLDKREMNNRSHGAIVWSGARVEVKMTWSANGGECLLHFQRDDISENRSCRNSGSVSIDSKTRAIVIWLPEMKPST